MRQFNTAGPSVAADDYCVNPLTRFDLDEILSLIASKRYFVLHAPRQTGKTTCLLALMKYLNSQGRYRALYANIETAQTARNDVSHGLRAVCSSVASSLRMHLGDTATADAWLDIFNEHGHNAALLELLRTWTLADPSRPTVLFLDEIDALVGDTLVSVLRQLRTGYADRPDNFPISVILCGVRDVRDYRIHTGSGEIITGGSAFNVKAESLRLGNFNQADIVDLYGQHTADTGQRFADEVFALLWKDTAGQPWLVNALGREACFKMAEGKDRSRTIDAELYRQARERLIQSRATHLDQLIDKLQEERVHRVISAVLAGDGNVANTPLDDLQYVQDMGLITLDKQIRISNAIYQEVIPRELTWATQKTIVHDLPWYTTTDRRLDMPKLLGAFQQFFRENADAWIERFQYKEAGPQLLLQAFLQRIINGGGRITREYGLGMKRMDLFLEWPLDEVLAFRGPMQRVVLELKIQRSGLKSTLVEALPQTAGYAATCGADEAHLLLFDRSSAKPWSKKIWKRSETVEGRLVQVWGM
jgi:hypothetical protein